MFLMCVPPAGLPLSAETSCHMHSYGHGQGLLGESAKGSGLLG